MVPFTQEQARKMHSTLVEIQSHLKDCIKVNGIGSLSIIELAWYVGISKLLNSIKKENRDKLN